MSSQDFGVRGSSSADENNFGLGGAIFSACQQPHSSHFPTDPQGDIGTGSFFLAILGPLRPRHRISGRKKSPSTKSGTHRPLAPAWSQYECGFPVSTIVSGGHWTESHHDPNAKTPETTGGRRKWRGMGGFRWMEAPSHQEKKKKKPKMYPQGHCDHREDRPDSAAQKNLFKCKSLNSKLFRPPGCRVGPRNLNFKNF